MNNNTTTTTTAGSTIPETLVQLCQAHDWERAIALVQTDPAQAATKRDPSPLALACRYGAPLACVQALYEANKQLIILSNTSAPADKALQKLPKFGFDATHITTGAVTSGEEAARYIRQAHGSSSPNQQQPQQRALMLTWDATDPNNPRLTALPEQFLESCGDNIALATSVDEADFLLLHGSEVWYRGPDLPAQSLEPFITQGSFEAVDDILQACCHRRLPMVCANPDNVVLAPDGMGFAHMPGKLAMRYLELLKASADYNANAETVDCRIFGKPHVEHFQACLQKLQDAHGISADRVAHVGDSLHHDIAGAAATGIASIWTASSGIHAQDLQLQFGQQPTADQVRELLQKEGTPAPTHVVPAFVW